MTSLYDALGVAKGASTDEIRAAYRKLARTYHPDVNPGDAEAERRFKEVSAAYDTLSDPEKRALYDEFGEDATRSGFDPEKARAFKRWQEQAGGGPGGVRYVFTGDGEGLDEFDFADLLGGMFGGAPRGRPRPASRRGADVRTTLSISLEEAALGGARSVRLLRPSACESCAGQGCQACRGGGVVERSVSLDIRVPAGVEDGQKLRLAGQGAAGRQGGPPGDLLVELQIQPHALYRREGRDLHLDLPVTVPEAMLGAKVDVPTLEGEVSLTIPPRSNGGRRLRLRGKGLPGRGGLRGDLYVTLQVVVPPLREDDPAARELIESLRALYPVDVRSPLTASRRAG